MKWVGSPQVAPWSVDTMKQGFHAILEGEFELVEPGTFAVHIETATGRYSDHGGVKVVDTGHEVTLEVLRREVPKLSGKGVELVPVSQLVHN